MAARNEKKTEVKTQGTNEVELIVKKKSVLDFTNEIHDDNNEIIKEDVRFYATNVRKFVEVNTRRQTKKILFGFYR